MELMYYISKELDRDVSDGIFNKIWKEKMDQIKMDKLQKEHENSLKYLEENSTAKAFVEILIPTLQHMIHSLPASPKYCVYVLQMITDQQKEEIEKSTVNASGFIVDDGTFINFISEWNMEKHCDKLMVAIKNTYELTVRISDYKGIKVRNVYGSAIEWIPARNECKIIR